MNHSTANFEMCNQVEQSKQDIKRIIFHVDVNSAYLSWMAAYRLEKGDPIDLRTIPSVIGGDELSRHGIVLAKSIPAKKYGIKTGNPIRQALEQCPHLKIVSPDYYLFHRASQSMVSLLREYSPNVQQFSVDECFIDFTHMTSLFGDPIETAQRIRQRIKDELGFTVNIGISNNKILAKMASDFKKPDRVHTLFPEEVPHKMWPLPVGDLFMVGRRTEAKLKAIGIHTIGALATASLKTLQAHFKSYGLMIYQYANGIDSSTVRSSNFEQVKGIGNSTTIHFDVMDKEDAFKVLLSLTESVASRLRQGEFCCGLAAVSIVTNEFDGMSHQRKLDVATDSTNYIYHIIKELFVELWDGQTPIRKLGVRVSQLQSNTYYQESMFMDFDVDREHQIDQCVDALRQKFGKNIVTRASFLHSGIKPINGGIGEEDYPVMTSIL